MATDPLHPFSDESDNPADDIAERSYFSVELENYLYVNGFMGECSLGSLKIPPQNPLDPVGMNLDALILYWLGMDRRRYMTLPFFVRQAKLKAAYERECQALEAGLVPKLDPPYTRQTIEDIRNLFSLMDAYDRITGIQNRVRRITKLEMSQQLQGGH